MPTKETKPRGVIEPAKIVQSIKLIQYFDEHWYEITRLDGQKEMVESATTVLDALSKGWLPSYYGGIGNREAELRLSEASQRGKRLHRAFSTLAKNGLVLYDRPEWQEPDLELKEKNRFLVGECALTGTPFYVIRDQDEMVQVNRVEQWFRAFNPNPETTGLIVEASEFILGSLENPRSAGTSDFKGLAAGGTYQIAGSKPLDVPRGRGLVDWKSGVEDESHLLQLADYIILDEKQFGERVDWGAIVYTNAQTKTGIPGLKTVLIARDEVDTYFDAFLNVQKMWHFQHPNAAPKVLEFKSVAYRGANENILTGFVQPQKIDF